MLSTISFSDTSLPSHCTYTSVFKETAFLEAVFLTVVFLVVAFLTVPLTAAFTVVVFFAGASFSVAGFAVDVLSYAFFVVVLVAIIASLQDDYVFSGTRILRFVTICNCSFRS